MVPLGIRAGSVACVPGGIGHGTARRGSTTRSGITDRCAEPTYVRPNWCLVPAWCSCAATGSQGRAATASWYGRALAARQHRTPIRAARRPNGSGRHATAACRSCWPAVSGRSAPKPRCIAKFD